MNDMTTPSASSDDSIPFVEFDIERIVSANPYDEDRLAPVYEILDAEIRAYGPLPQIDDSGLPFEGKIVKPYGEYMSDHLAWTSETLKAFLCWKGYDEDVASRIAQAFKRHDVGKADMPDEWKITNGKQNISEERKIIRTKTHCELGEERISQALEDSTRNFCSEEKVGFAVAAYLARYHHERLDGSGPFGLSARDMCPVLRAATIVDTFHGKLKADKTHEEICNEMAYGKLRGQFDVKMIEDFKSFMAGMTPDPREEMLFQP